MNSPRSYRLGARAASMQETRKRILEAARDALLTRYYDDYTLGEIARTAGVTVQTVLRHFGSKDDLLAAVEHDLTADVEAEIFQVPVGDVPAAITILYARYERMGDGNFRLAGQEERVASIAAAVKHARAFHRAWVERTFAPFLPPKGHPDRQRRLLQWLVLCDVNTWKTLRRDYGGSRAATLAAVLELCDLLIRGQPEERR